MAAPDLLRDTVHNGSFRPTNEWAAEKAKCTRFTFIVSNCSVTAVHRSPTREKRELAYFTFANWGGQNVEFVSSTKNPGVISLRRAAEGLTGRWALFLTLVGLMTLSSAKGFTTVRTQVA
jgi:hypothetical protein